MSVIESFEQGNYKLIAAVSCLIPDIGPKRLKKNLGIGQRNCSATGLMVNFEMKSIMEQSSSPSITFELNIKKRSKGTLTINYFIDGSEQCSAQKVLYGMVWKWVYFVYISIFIYILIYVLRFLQVPEFNNKTFNSVSIYGLGSEKPSQITKNNGSTTVIDESQWHFDLDLGYLKVVDIALNLCDSINWIY